MAEPPDRFREEGKNLAAADAHYSAARDDKDERSDRVTARLLDMCIDLQAKVFDHMTITGANVRELKDGLTRLEKKVEEFVSAFPEGDAIKHRLAHEDYMKKRLKRETFREKITFTIAVFIICGVLGWLAVVVWGAFLMGPK